MIALLLVGFMFIGVGVFLAYQGRVPREAIRFAGTVISVTTKNIEGSKLHGPTVRYTHPQTGQVEVLEPVSFGDRSFDVGEEVDLAYVAKRDRVMRADPELNVVGGVVAALGVFAVAVALFGF